jgi:hypothetical protein
MMQRQFHTLALSIAILTPLLLMACNAPNATSSVPRSPLQPSPQTEPIAQAKNPTVEDYFLELPEQYFKIFDRDKVPVSVRQKLLKQSGSVVDRENGYISTSSIAPDLCNYQMAIFRRDRGAHLVAFNLGCTTYDTLTILDPDRNWANVTATVFPTQVLQSKPGEIGVMVKLPRYGRTIEDENNKVVAKVTFDGKEFQLER